MKKYVLTLADSIKHIPEYPERTAHKNIGGWDEHYQVWPNRISMAKSIRMQGRRAPHPHDWKACIKLNDGEGY